MKQMKGLRRIMRPLKARGKEWVHGLVSGGDGGGGPSKVSKLGRPSGRHGNGRGGGQGQSKKEEEEDDSDGSDLVRNGDKLVPITSPATHLWT